MTVPLAEAMIRHQETWDWLAHYDGVEPPPPTPAPMPTAAAVRHRVAEWRRAMAHRGQSQPLFGRERGEALTAILGSILSDSDAIQPDDAETAAWAAARLLDAIIRHHPFADGNKRIGALLFAEALDASGLQPWDDRALTCVAIMVAATPATERNRILSLIATMAMRPFS